MSRRFVFALSIIALLSMACGLTSMIPGSSEVQAALTELAPALETAGAPPLGTAGAPADATSPGLPEFEQDEDTVIHLVEDGQAGTLFDRINESAGAEMLKPGVERYTVDIKTTDLIDLSTGWCAKDKVTMESNEKHITGSITVDGYVIPDDQLVSFASTVEPGQSTDYPDGLSCYSWDIVARNWPAGTHHVTEAWALDSKLEDGYAEYQAGAYSIEYTITVTE